MRLHTSILTVIFVNSHIICDNRTTAVAAINERRKQRSSDGKLVSITKNPVGKRESHTPQTETTAEQEVIGQNIVNKVKVERRSRFNETNKKDSTSLIIILVSLGVAALVCFVAVTVIIVAILRKKRRKKKEEAEKTKKVLIAKKPRKMEAADVNATKFTHGGALVLAAKLQGPVVHAEGDSEGESIHTIQFDPHLNEIVDIGSNIEVLPDTGDTTCTDVGVVQNEKNAMNTLRKAINKTFATRRNPTPKGTPKRRPLKNPQSKPLFRAEATPKKR
ncbi:unnamed protein product [Cylicocyclus nassatus]|uniref:Uncharacterized protein n=1 Tax=Cylicocyclus nassatus TaxID=53992 RepID=A0AA36GVD4_CYLNA|nr:unnamed protein product [Cylicocyclus nassatus]